MNNDITITEEEYKVLIDLHLGNFDKVFLSSFDNKVLYYDDIYQNLSSYEVDLESASDEPKEVFSTFKEAFEKVFKNRLIERINDFGIEDVKELVSNDLYNKISALNFDIDREINEIEEELEI